MNNKKVTTLTSWYGTVHIITCMLRYVMEFKWTKECSELVSKHRKKDPSLKKTLNVKDFVNMLNDRL